VRLDVDVAGTRFRRVAQDQVHQLDDRRQLNLSRERGRIDQVVLAVGSGFDLAGGLRDGQHVVIRRAIAFRKHLAEQLLEPGLGDDDRDHLLAGAELRVLKHRIVQRIGDRDLQHGAGKADRRGPALQAERNRQQRRDRFVNRRRLAAEKLEMHPGRDRRGDGGFRGEAERGQRPAERGGVSRLRLEGERQAGGVNEAGTDEQIADESLRVHP
jgi:hypothetical protein